MPEKRKTLIIYGILFFIAVLRLTWVFNINLIHGHSMEPTFHPGTVVVSSCLKKPTYGTIVVVKASDGKYVIKRVIGMPGDTVELRDGVIYLNNEKLEENYVLPDTCARKTNVTTYVLSKDQYFISGDNRCNSYDSRSYGPISKKNLLASVL